MMFKNESEQHLIDYTTMELIALIGDLRDKAEHYEKAIEEFKKEYEYEHHWQLKNVEGNKRSQWQKGALAGFNHIKRIFDNHFKEEN